MYVSRDLLLRLTEEKEERKKKRIEIRWKRRSTRRERALHRGRCDDRVARLASERPSALSQTSTVRPRDVFFVSGPRPIFFAKIILFVNSCTFNLLTVCSCHTKNIYPAEEQPSGSGLHVKLADVTDILGIFLELRERGVKGTRAGRGRENREEGEGRWEERDDATFSL